MKDIYYFTIQRLVIKISVCFDKFTPKRLALWGIHKISLQCLTELETVCSTSRIIFPRPYDSAQNFQSLPFPPLISTPLSVYSRRRNWNFVVFGNGKGRRSVCSKLSSVLTQLETNYKRVFQGNPLHVPQMNPQTERNIKVNSLRYLEVTVKGGKVNFTDSRHTAN